MKSSRILISFLLAIPALGACVTPAPISGPGAPVEIRGSASTTPPAAAVAGCDELIPIYAETTRDGIARENAWIARNYPGAQRIGQTSTSCKGIPVDVITIRTAEGYEQQVWFDVSSFFGRTQDDNLDDLLDG